MTPRLTPEHVAALRLGLAELPRASNHAPGASVDPADMVIVPGHRAALDPDRALVVASRGMGKSFWTHALATPAARQKVADQFHQLANIDVRIGFNASERSEAIAPTVAAIGRALRDGVEPGTVWLTVLAQAAAVAGGANFEGPKDDFGAQATWVQSHGQSVENLLTAVDDAFFRAGKRLVVVFDALDRLADDWGTTRVLSTALLKRALAVGSYRSLRFKLFMRTDQFEDPRLFEFPDGSKTRNTRVDLKWETGDLYALLCDRLAQSPLSAPAFRAIQARVPTPGSLFDAPPDTMKSIVDALAGEFMGANKRRGRVYTWLPLHLADARKETSPRTFLTAWREAARHSPAPPDRPVDYLGLLEGVRKASEDRLHELEEDFWWIGHALEPLRGQMVPMELSLLEARWLAAGTVGAIRHGSPGRPYIPTQLDDATRKPEAALVHALATIGVLEVRPNGKINVPDIFRVEAGIKRKGGQPPRRPAAR